MKATKINITIWPRIKLAWKILWKYPMGMTEAHYFFNLTPEGAHARIAHETRNYQVVEVIFKAFKSDKQRKAKNSRGRAW